LTNPEYQYIVCNDNIDLGKTSRSSNGRWKVKAGEILWEEFKPVHLIGRNERAISYFVAHIG
jgi:hypothetical protein